MKKNQLPKTAYLQEHLGWLKGAMSYLDGDEDKDNELGRYELEHAIWLLKKVQRLDIEAVDVLIEAIESELRVLKANGTIAPSCDSSGP